MKRSSSSASKENPGRIGINKHSFRPQRTNDQQIKLYCTQSLVPDHHSRECHPWNTPLTDFYKTFGHNNYVQLSRPESKQAFRKCIGRPETSKGIRPLEKNNRRDVEGKAGFHSQYAMERKEEQTEPQSSNAGNIEIIVTKSNIRCSEKKIVRSKFETDLDDQFLQLFAN